MTRGQTGPAQPGKDSWAAPPWRGATAGLRRGWLTGEIDSSPGPRGRAKAPLPGRGVGALAVFRRYAYWATWTV